jgi:ATP-dependent 26S proteasome regulatory subunit
MVSQDEIDSLAAARQAGDDPPARRLLTELLLQLSGLASSTERVFVLAATNRLQV